MAVPRKRLPFSGSRLWDRGTQFGELVRGCDQRAGYFLQSLVFRAPKRYLWRRFGLHLTPFSADENKLEAQRVAEREKIARQEAEMLARRRQEEEEGKRRVMAQQQQSSQQQSQIELVLMERICTILENSY